MYPRSKILPLVKLLNIQKIAFSMYVVYTIYICTLFEKQESKIKTANVHEKAMRSLWKAYFIIIVRIVHIA